MGIIKAWLKPTALKSASGDYTAVVKTYGSLNMIDIVNELKEDGMEFQPETVVDIIQRYCRKAAERVADGYSVNTGLVNMRPTVRGSFRGDAWDEQRHRVRIAVRPSALLRRAAEGAHVELVNQLPPPRAIHSVKDLTTGRTDGSLTRGHVAELRGSYLKIVGTAPAVGIAFRHAETGTIVRLDPTDIALNNPSRLLITIPSTLPPGPYALMLTTQGTSSSQRMLKEPCVITRESITII